jgi:hypothetical protein
VDLGAPMVELLGKLRDASHRSRCMLQGCWRPSPHKTRRQEDMETRSSAGNDISRSPGLLVSLSLVEPR